MSGREKKMLPALIACLPACLPVCMPVCLSGHRCVIPRRQTDKEREGGGRETVRHREGQRREGRYGYGRFIHF